MAIGEKIVEVGLAGASAAIATFAVYLWGQIEHLEREIVSTQKAIAAIEQSGEVKIAQMRECESLSDKILQARKDIALSVMDEAKELFEKRDCNITQKAK